MLLVLLLNTIFSISATAAFSANNIVHNGNHNHRHNNENYDNSNNNIMSIEGINAVCRVEVAKVEWDALQVRNVRMRYLDT